MDNKDRQQVNTNTVWQWRISHAKKYSTHPDPFYYSNRIGLDFNVGSNSQKKRNPPFVPNGVILEVCEFARTIIKSGIHFIPNILENNFDLGFGREQQRIDFTAQIQHKLEELIQKPPKDAHGVLAPFDIWNTECISNELYVAPMVHKPQRSLVEDIGELEHLCSSEKVTEEMPGSHSDGDGRKDDTGCLGMERGEKFNEHDPLLFPFCESIGLNLGLGTKQKLDPGLLSKGVMLELVAFAQVLTASFTSIVTSLLEHNFELGLKSQQRNEVWLLISQMLEKFKQITATDPNLSPQFKNEPFFFARDPLKRSYVKALSPMETLLSEMTKKQKLHLNPPPETMRLSLTKCIINKDQGQQDPSHNFDLCPSKIEEDEHCYMCPVEDDTDSENGNGVQNSTSCGISTESSSDLFGTQYPATTYDSCNSSTMNKDMCPFALQPNKTVAPTCEETQISRNASNDCGMDRDLVIDYNMWKLRSHRANEIYLSLGTRRLDFKHLWHVRVDFDIGFGPKRSLSIDRLTTTPFLLKLAQFALAMNSSQEEFILEILENNFDLMLKNERAKKTFMCKVMNKVKDLQRCEDVVKFSKEVFELPGSVSRVPIGRLSNNGVITEPSTMSNTGYCKAMPMCAPNSHPETGLDLPSEPESVSEDDMDLYPFCKEIGLRFQVNYRQSIGKLDINKLTKGAMTEIVNFAEKLCGTFEQICMDVLRHNFDLQSMDSNVAETIFAQVAVVNQKTNACVNLSQKMMKHDIMDPSILVYGRKPRDMPAQNDHNLLKWMLRANHIQHILSVPHGDQCPLYLYSRCKKLGLDFDIASGVKRNLDPKCLTHGIMVELMTFAKKLQSSKCDFILEILEYNFDLNFNSELHRRAFVQSLKVRISVLSLKKKRCLRKSPFELPDLRCLKETPPSCPKCHRDRNENLPQDESGSQHIPHVHPHDIKDKSHAHHCTKPMFAKIPVADFSSTEILTKPYHHSKEVGLSLCVDRDHPKEKLDVRSLTEEVMDEVTHFAHQLCGSKHGIVNEVLKHNFNFSQDCIENASQVYTLKWHKPIGDFSWLNEVADLENLPSKKQNGRNDCFEKASSFGIVKESSCEGASSFTTTDDLPNLPVNTDLSPPLLNLSAEVMQQEGETEAGNLESIPNEFDINVQKFRSNLMKNQSRLCHLRDIDVGFGPPRNLSTELLTTSVLYEVASFAVALSSSQQNVVMEILQYNFNLGLQSQYHKEKFAREVMKRVQVLLACEDGGTFSKGVFALPRSLSFRNVDCRSDDRVVSDPGTSPTTPDIYPFCKEIGLRLDVSDCLPDKKLDINKLTNGAMIEVVNFAEKLCGSYEQICVDILQHNFDLDLQSADSDLARNTLAQIPFAIEESKFYCNFRKLRHPIKRHSVVMDSRWNAYSQICPPSPVEAQMNECVSVHSDVEAQNNPAMLLWKLRANQVQQIISVTHKEQCPLYSYTRCKKLDIDFDVASGLKRNLDPKLLTNGIMSELFTFATELASSEMAFVTEILDYNFDLHLNDELDRSTFVDAVCQKIQLMNRKRGSVILQETQFELPDKTSFHQVAPFCTKCSDDDLRHIESKPDDMLNDSPHTMATVASASTDCQEKKPENAPMSTFPATEELTKQYHCSKKAGLSLCVDKAHPKVKLDKCVLTNEVIQDLCTFSRNLCGEKYTTIKDILEHNFSLDTETKSLVDLLEQLKLYDGQPSWFDEVFDLNPICEDEVKLKKTPVLRSERRKLEMQKHKELIIQRQQMEKTKSSYDSDLSTNKPGEDYMCPVEEDTDSENEEQAQVPNNSPNNCDLHQEDMDPELKMWKLRSNRVRQILSVLHNMPCQLFKSHVSYLNVELDVGFQPKKNLSADNLTNFALFNVALFALEMTASQEEFMMEILKYNFDLDFQSQYNEKSFAHGILKQVREIINCEEAVKCLEEVFDVSFGLKYPNSCSSKSKSHPTSSTKECDVSPLPASSLTAETKLSTTTESSQNSVALYPFCNDIGLNLNVCGCQPKRKLEIDKLTKGALIEVVNFAERLCGSYEQICWDVLRHNFDLGLQSADSDLARKILEQVPLVIEQRQLERNFKRTRQTRLDPININWQNSTSSEPCTGPIKANIDRSVSTQSYIKVQHDPHLLLWKLRANRIKQILSVPHGEQCPLYPYNRCKKLGIDFNVGSGLKRSLDPKLLTNGIMNELCTFAQALQSSVKHFITEIWEDNFDLNLKNERHRSAFTQYASVKCGKGKGHTKMSLFKLPDPKCIEEKAPDCRKCYQDGATAGAICSELKPDEPPITTFPACEILTRPYHHCKEVGLSLCVDRNYSRDKLDMRELTISVQEEIHTFAKKLCGRQNKLWADILEHNFNFSTHDQAATVVYQFCTRRVTHSVEPAWFNEEFHLEVFPPRQTYPKIEPSFEMKETLKRRRLDMEAKKEQNNVPAVKKPNLELNSQHGDENTSGINDKKDRLYDMPSESGENLVHHKQSSKSTKTEQKTKRVKSLSTHDDKRFQSMQGDSSSDDEWSPPEHRLRNTSSNAYGHVHIKEEIGDPLCSTPEIDLEELYPCGDDYSRYLGNQGDSFTVKPQEIPENMNLTKCPSGEVLVKEESEMKGIQYCALPAPQLSGHPNVLFYPPGQYVIGTVSDTNIVMCKPLQYSIVALQQPLIKVETQKQRPDEMPL